MDTSFQKTKNTTDEWYTPKEIIDALGTFDLDPCAPQQRLWNTAKLHYTKDDNGLTKDWSGCRVWLNPPYSRPLINQFVKKMIDNNNGIMLTFNRTDNKMFQDYIFPNAAGMMFMRGRIKFYKPDGTQGDSSGCGSVLVAFGKENAEILKHSNIPGVYVDLK